MWLQLALFLVVESRFNSLVDTRINMREIVSQSEIHYSSGFRLGTYQDLGTLYGVCVIFLAFLKQTHDC
jgi:hypothetical protein